ncbi:UvrD-helicase domain-containing protein [Aquimarina sp. MMG016]|uniref:UvrD-helicase domain-containing protein n=1 Tax=Aquimarina sp. MMG016 TaxID=2822690 RepID=UPI001B39FD03|nr:UvrD-helicase domain-containing protein [Aquimarina sp. MMG016]MBQ4818893.1 UvrD-helicase domain-containing protein [Aquimarina sp. MMG016]
MEIAENDIKRVEEIFFNGNGSFQDEKGERYAFISCLDKSIDVEACPGSGKTTSLLAKLYLLSERMPFENGKGICVLTHTNVAIEEIRKKLGNKADRLFQYPNFFGTIQSFVDKYLAIPYYVGKNKLRPRTIDSEIATKRLFTTYHVNHVSRQNLNRAKILLHQPNGIASNLTLKRTEEGVVIVKGCGGDKIEVKIPKNQNWEENSETQVYEALQALKIDILSNGYLSFDDAYFYANEYLMNYPRIKQTISSRFSHVFIDEMQDTYAHQDEIIKEIFDKHIVIQRIGDPNQAILNDSNSESAWEDSERLKITGSRRFSQPIAKVLRTVALNGDSELTGTGEATIQPHIISYRNGQETQVLERFVSLIHKLGLDDSDAQKDPIKAVGWVGKEKDGLTISSYFPSFSKVMVRKKSLDTLKSAVQICEATNPKEVYNTVMDCCLEILRLADIKHDTPKGRRYFNRTSFLGLLKRHHPESLITLNGKISIWGRKLLVNKTEEVIQEIRPYLKDIFFPAINFTLNKYANAFIDSEEVVEVTEEQLESKNTFYSEQEKMRQIPIEVGTVHSVKGETHRVTLYLETFYHKSCGQHLIDQLIGTPYTPPQNKKDTYKKACLKIAHVGMSRPTHLLCVALNEEIVEAHRAGLEENGWNII